MENILAIACEEAITKVRAKNFKNFNGIKEGYKIIESLPNMPLKVKQYLLSNPKDVARIKALSEEEIAILNNNIEIIVAPLENYSIQTIKSVLNNYMKGDINVAFDLVESTNVGSKSICDMIGKVHIDYETFQSLDSNGKEILSRMPKNSMISNENIVEILDRMADDEGFINLMHYFSDINIKISPIRFIKIVSTKGFLTNATKLWFKVKKTNPNKRDFFDGLYDVLVEDEFNEKNFSSFVRNFDETQWHCNLLSYMNIVTRGKAETIANSCPSWATNLVLYAMRQRKWGFIKTLESNIDIIQEKRTYNDYLTNERLYTSGVYNLNELNINDILLLVSTPSTMEKITDILSLTNISTKELCVLVKSNYTHPARIYSRIVGKIDTKTLVFNQLQNIGYHLSKNEEANVNFFERINIQNFAIRKKDLPFECSNSTIIKMLETDKSFDNLFLEAKSEVDIIFILRNLETINKELSLEENKENFLKIDNDSKEMLSLLSLSSDFKEKNKDNIRNFCITGKSNIVMTFWRNIVNTSISSNAKEIERNAILRIAKAAISPDWEKFKFFDLSKEIEFELTNEISEKWKQNSPNLVREGFTAYETCSFEDTMNIGVYPNHTCMNYIDGGYRYCLLANFDSNKKFLFAKKGDRIVARAIVRFTKSTNSKINQEQKMSFVDIENANIEDSYVKVKQEKLTLFLEHLYTSHISSNEERKIANMFVEMMERKAQSMNARLVLSTRTYSNVADDRDYEHTNLNIFISHTKNEYQYMDSLGGANSVQNEATYYPTSCYVRE